MKKKKRLVSFSLIVAAIKEAGMWENLFERREALEYYRQRGVLGEPPRYYPYAAWAGQSVYLTNNSVAELATAIRALTRLA